jgi:hypothetical protein
MWAMHTGDSIRTLTAVLSADLEGCSRPRVFLLKGIIRSEKRFIVGSGLIGSGQAGELDDLWEKG